MNPKVNRVLKIVAAVAAAMIVALVLIRLLDVLMIWSVYSWFFQTVRNASGLPDTLTGALSIWLTAITILLLPTFLSALIFRRGVTKICIIASALSGWLVILYFISQPKDGQFFNPMTGQAMYKYAKTPKGRIDLFPLGYSFHPRYGTKLELVTLETIKEFEKTSEQTRESPEGLPDKEKYSVVPVPHATCRNDAEIYLDALYKRQDSTLLDLRFLGPVGYNVRLTTDYYGGAQILDELGNVYGLVKYIGPIDAIGGWETMPGRPVEFKLLFPQLPPQVKKVQVVFGGLCQRFEMNL